MSGYHGYDHADVAAPEGTVCHVRLSPVLLLLCAIITALHSGKSKSPALAKGKCCRGNGTTNLRDNHFVGKASKSPAWPKEKVPGKVGTANLESSHLGRASLYRKGCLHRIYVLPSGEENWSRKLLQWPTLSVERTTTRSPGLRDSGSGDRQSAESAVLAINTWSPIFDLPLLNAPARAALSDDFIHFPCHLQ